MTSELDIRRLGSFAHGEIAKIGGHDWLVIRRRILGLARTAGIDYATEAAAWLTVVYDYREDKIHAYENDLRVIARGTIPAVLELIRSSDCADQAAASPPSPPARKTTGSKVVPIWEDTEYTRGWRK